MNLTKEQSLEIKEQQSQKNQTKRVTAPELEKILYIKTFYETMWIELGKTIKYISFKI
jgi:hypothetical protein